MACEVDERRQTGVDRRVTVMARPRTRIDVVEFVRAEPASEGGRVSITLVDSAGGTVVVSVSDACLGEIMAALPRPVCEANGEAVHAWRLEQQGPHTATMRLTLQTAEGRVARFSITPGQLAGMATLATYGGFASAHAKPVN